MSQMATPFIARENSIESPVPRGSPVAWSCSPVARGSPRVARSASRGPSLLQRALSASFEQQMGSQLRGRVDASSPACGETSRKPLQPLAPPPMVSAPSFGSESDDELPPPSTFKRQKIAPSGFLSPLGQHCAMPHAGLALRPPPIRTIVSLEGPELAEAVPALIRVPSDAGPSVPSLLRVPSCEPVPTTPSLGARGGGGFRGSRLAAPPMSLVAPSLYIGDEASAVSEQRLRQQGITHVLNCTAKPNLALEAQVADSSLHYLRLNLLDSTSDLPRMQSVMREGVDFIRSALQEGGTVLVHCHRGISRSCTLVMAYLIEAEQRSAESVFESIRSKRRIADPNLGYWCALQEWEKQVLPQRLHRQRSSSRLSRDSPQLFAQMPRPLSRAG